jgi:DNA-binding transcriptional ArsR family regulator
MEPRLDIIGAALADASRLRILCELMDGRAFTNKELACAAQITAQTATTHLQHLEQAGLTRSLRSGRHVYHQIASEEVAQVLETLARLSPRDHLTRGARQAPDMLVARCCYNHLAGRLGVLVTQAVIARDVLQLSGEALFPAAQYERFAQDLGAALPGRSKASLAKLCLDWTERRFHLSGPFATALLAYFLQEGWLTRQQGQRALKVTEKGYAGFEAHFGISRAEIGE